jgi:SAM-dependent methyltransferase
MSAEQAGVTRSSTPPMCAWCGVSIPGGSRRSFGRVQCERCGVANTAPWPTDAQLEQAYGSWYRPDSGRFAGIGDTVLRRTRGRLAKRLNEIAPPGRILDVGAGDGSLLDALASVGRQALGLEREASRPDVVAGDLGDIEGEWAAIVFWHSLEHLRNPGEEIERAAALLTPSGVLVVAVPNASSLQAGLFGNRWLALDLPRHLTHIPAEVLIARLRELSLNVDRVSYWRGGQVVFGWLHGLVGMLPGGLNLYDAIRQPEARSRPLSTGARLATVAAGALLSPVALIAAAAEIAAGRGGTVYVEARRG